MTSTSIICVRKEVEPVLEALNNFGEFHIEQTAQDNAGLNEYNQSIQNVEGSLADLNTLTNQLIKEKSSFFSIFNLSQTTNNPCYSRELANSFRRHKPKNFNPEKRN